MRETSKQPDANRDPITGAPGAHPVGTGVGAAAGGAAGAAAGTAVGGPVGTLVGAAVGAIAGGLMGKGVAEMVDPTVEDTYWRENHRNEPYYTEGRNYDDFYAPAYRAGYEGRVKYDGRTFDEVESDLQADYRRYSDMDSWDEVRPASRAAWDRVDRRVQDATRN
jgi:uncharacterized protein YcfJ